MKSKITSVFFLVSALMLPTITSAQTAVVTYGVQVPVPALGTFGLLTMGLLLALFGFIWVKKHPNTAHKLAVTAIAAGLLTSAGTGGWLVSNAEAIPSITDYLFSENSSPVSVTNFPASLTNDLAESALIISIDVSGCQTPTEITGTCEEGAFLAGNGGSCSLDSVCAPDIPTGLQCDTGTDTYTNSPWVICESTPDELWISADNQGTYNADLICQDLGFDRAGQRGGTCGNVCGYCEATTSCDSPGNKTFDGNGASSGDYGLVMAVTVHWTCVNDPAG